VLVANNNYKIVDYVDYNRDVIYLTSNLANVVNSLMSVNRTFNSDNIQIYGPLGTQYHPELTAETGQRLTTEDEKIILIG
jgi:hypothetical protein